METFKSISITFFLLMTMFSYLKHDISYNAHILDRTENSIHIEGDQGLNMQESSLEEDPDTVLTINDIRIDNNEYQPVISQVYSIPLRLFYSIWVPPQLS